jgi:hypothetical protein
MHGLMSEDQGCVGHGVLCCRGISQLYRSPDTTHLVGNLKDQLREMKATRDQLTSELTSLQKSTRATKVCAPCPFSGLTASINRIKCLNLNG